MGHKKGDDLSTIAVISAALKGLHYDGAPALSTKHYTAV